MNDDTSWHTAQLIELVAAREHIAELEAKLQYIDEHKEECDCGLAWWSEEDKK